MSIKKKASAHWEGDLKTGLGSISTETGVLREAPYGFKARFEGGKGSSGAISPSTAATNGASLSEIGGMDKNSSN